MQPSEAGPFLGQQTSPDEHKLFSPVYGTAAPKTRISPAASHPPLVIDLTDDSFPDGNWFATIWSVQQIERSVRARRAIADGVPLAGRYPKGKFPPRSKCDKSLSTTICARLFHS